MWEIVAVVICFALAAVVALATAARLVSAVAEYWVAPPKNIVCVDFQ